jgi:hypothetical protein
VTEHGQESILSLVSRLRRRYPLAHLGEGVRQFRVQVVYAFLLFFDKLLAESVTKSSTAP